MFNLVNYLIMSNFDDLKDFEIINMGMLKMHEGGCGADADRLCVSWCSGGCAHDGCCSGFWDHKGDTACKSSGKDVIQQEIR